MNTSGLEVHGIVTFPGSLLGPSVFSCSRTTVNAWSHSARTHFSGNWFKHLLASDPCQLAPSSKAVVSTRDDFAPAEDIWQHLETSWLSQMGGGVEGATDIQWERSRILQNMCNTQDQQRSTKPKSQHCQDRNPADFHGLLADLRLGSKFKGLPAVGQSGTMAVIFARSTSTRTLIYLTCLYELTHFVMI